MPSTKSHGAQFLLLTPPEILPRGGRHGAASPPLTPHFEGARRCPILSVYVRSPPLTPHFEGVRQQGSKPLMEREAPPLTPHFEGVRRPQVPLSHRVSRVFAGGSQQDPDSIAKSSRLSENKSPRTPHSRYPRWVGIFARRAGRQRPWLARLCFPRCVRSGPRVRTARPSHTPSEGYPSVSPDRGPRRYGPEGR